MTTGLLTTTLGRNAIIADLGGGADLALTHVAWGDANGVPYAPNEAQTALVNEKYRATIAAVAVVAGAIVVDAIIPADTADGSGRPSHGFNVAEVGLFNSTGTLIGLARCGNGYKPPPSSGQAAAVTYRLKLAVANPSAITVIVDPQAQIAIGRHVRAPWLTVDGVLNAPPANPNQGDTYVIGSAPTGAWTGFANRIAQWVGVWSLSSVPLGHHVVDNSKGADTGARWLERTAGGWVPGLSRLIQRQPGNYVVAGGTANALTAAADPALTTALPGLALRLRIAVNNTAAATLDAGDGARPIVTPRGEAIRQGDLVAGAIVTLIDTGAAWMLSGIAYSEVPRAAFNQVLYVRPNDGNDANDGSANDAGHAFATIAAAALAATKFYAAGGVVTIQLGEPGATYAAPGNIPAGSGAVLLRGNPANPGQFIISGAVNPAGAGALVAGVGGLIILDGVTLFGTGTGVSLVGMAGTGLITLRNTLLSTSVQLVGALIFSSAGGNVFIESGCTVSGSAGSAIFVSAASIAIRAGVTVSNGVGFTSAFCTVTNGGTIVVDGASFTGSATGQRYAAILNGVINTNGAGANFFPGNVAGAIATGGQYA